jgi:hypothetical protein
MQINQEGSPDQNHSLSPTPQDRADVQLSHDRLTRFGHFHVGVGYNYVDDEASGVTTSDFTGFIYWSTR